MCLCVKWRIQKLHEIVGLFGQYNKIQYRERKSRGKIQKLKMEILFKFIFPIIPLCISEFSNCRARDPGPVCWWGPMYPPTFIVEGIDENSWFGTWGFATHCDVTPITLGPGKLQASTVWLGAFCVIGSVNAVKTSEYMFHILNLITIISAIEVWTDFSRQSQSGSGGGDCHLT